LTLLKTFQNRRVQIICSYWTTDFSKLLRELLKGGQSQLAGFEIHHRFPIEQFSLEKRVEQRPPILKAGQGLSHRFSKAFCEFKVFSA
jgi:hypothetical protein